jgi:hypothetical protein
LAAQATSSATESVRFSRSQEVCSVVSMLAIFRRFYLESPGDSFLWDSEIVKDSTRLPLQGCENGGSAPHLPVKQRRCGKLKPRAHPGVDG